ncbi:unnamed protein product [Auanema sp. JU1783]|nr:unnamed protein product [Auanema sp. JU1783]
MDEDDFVRSKPVDNPILLAPKRPAKKNDDGIEDPPSLFANLSRKEDSFGISGLDSPPKEKIVCPLCMKDLSQLNTVRRSLHTNQCLDGQQTITNHQKAKEKHSLTIDCPICRKPLEPGPFRSAHIKKCGRESNVSASKLVDLLDLQTKVVEVNKKRGINHTSAPIPTVKAVKPQKLKNEPKTKLDEDLQLAKALSESMEFVSNKPPTFQHDSPQFQRLEDLKTNRKKRPRSYSIVQLAPHECQCQVLTLLHERFISMFKTRKRKPIRDYVAECDNKVNFLAIQERKTLDRLLHLENLAKDLYSLSDQSNKTFDFTLKCTDGEVNCHRMILEKRTREITQRRENICEVNASTGMVQYWLSYVYSGAIEWSIDDNESIRRLGLKYGPEGIIIACKRIENQEDENEREKCFLRRVKSATELLHKEPVLESKPIHPQCDDPLSENISTPPEDLHDDIISSETLYENKTVDCEDPLQGIHMDTSIISIESDITIINEVSKRSPSIQISDEKDKEESPELISTEEILDEPPLQEEVEPYESLIPQPNVSQSYYEANYDFPMNDEDIYRESFWKTNTTEEKEKTPDEVLQQPPDKNKQPLPARRRSSRLTRIRESLEGVQDYDSFDNPNMCDRLRMEPLDSFDEIDAQNNIQSHDLPIQSPSTSFAMPLAQSTPLQPSLKRPKFGSNVKILKTTEITPMPNYEGMDDNDLKKELARHGLRPMGRKRAVEYLRNIYESVHPGYNSCVVLV